MSRKRSDLAVTRRQVKVMFRPGLVMGSDGKTDTAQQTNMYFVIARHLCLEQFIGQNNDGKTSLHDKQLAMVFISHSIGMHSIMCMDQIN